jgi:TRAP-type mannitol/chloroaromatic compound transport system substrate-binding protein
MRKSKNWEEKMRKTKNLDRRSFVKAGGLLAGATAAATLAAPALAQKRTDMVIVSTWPRDFPGLGLSAQRLAKRIQQLTDGRIHVTYYAAGERVGAFASFDAVASGNAQAYTAAEYYWKGKHPAFTFFTTIPMGLLYSGWTPGSNTAAASSCGTRSPTSSA